MNHIILHRLIAIAVAINLALVGIIVTLSITRPVDQSIRESHAIAQELAAQRVQMANNPRVKSLVESENAEARGTAQRGLVTLKVLNVVTMNATEAKKFSGDSSAREFSRELIQTQNEIFAKSGVRLRVELADTVLDHTYTPRHADISRVTDDWMNDSKSFVAAKKARVSTNADIVMILTGGGITGGCGVAHTINDTFRAHDAVAAVDLTCQKSATTDLVYAHEMGHTLGLNHDRANAGDAGKIETTTMNPPASKTQATGQPGTPGYHDPRATNFGYVDTTNNVRDIMSYDTTCSKNPQAACTEVPMYSSPRILIPMEVVTGDHVTKMYQVPLGDSHDDAVGFMNSHLRYYAAMNFDARN